MSSSQPISGQASSCLDTYLPTGWNPMKWQYTSKKITKYAATVFVASLITIAFAALIVTCPRATGALFTTLSITAVVSLVVLVIGLVKRCNQQPKKNFVEQAREEVSESASRFRKKAEQAADDLQERFTKED